jgi:hypothetical protein
VVVVLLQAAACPRHVSLHPDKLYVCYSIVVAVVACLLQHGASAFMPYLNHLIGQPSQAGRRASAHSSHDAVGPSSGGGSTASSSISMAGKPFSASGILGCLSSQDWAVRRAAADAVRAVVLLVGPDLEPEDCWGLGDAGSVTGRCLSALEDCRFDKVRAPVLAGPCKRLAE